MLHLTHNEDLVYLHHLHEKNQIYIFYLVNPYSSNNVKNRALTETAADNHLVCKRKIDHLAKLAYK